jgi:NnrS protein
MTLKTTTACTSVGHLYRPFFVAAIVFMLSTGVGWGTHFLVQIASVGTVTGVSLPLINAHGHTMIYGFVVLFILGFALQSLPRLFRQPLAAPYLIRPAFFVFTLGIVLHVVAQTRVAGGSSSTLAVIAGVAETAALLVLVGQLLVSIFRGQSPGRAPVAGIVIGLCFLLVHTPLGAWLTATQLAAESRSEMIYVTSIYQPALRYLEYHGTTLLLIVAVGSLLLPRFYAIAAPSSRRMWAIILTIAVCTIGEAATFVWFRETESNAVGMLLLVPYVGLLTACAAWMLPWRPWRPLLDTAGRVDRMSKFVRASFVWLLVSLVMTILLPIWGMMIGTAFSHAIHGATRQAFVVGFATLMIMGFAARVVPNLNNVFPNRLPSLLASFILVNVGLVLHVIGLIGSDLTRHAVYVLPLAGLLQWVGIALWGGHLLRCIWSGRSGEAPTEPTEPMRKLRLQVVQ